MTKAKAPARFIVFEGGEGAGKSTQVQRLADALRARGQDVVTTREPGGSPGAEAIRALLVSGDTARWSPETEALLINAARADHLDRTIRPALAKGQWVICDRFADSTMAYQGYGMGLDRAWLAELRRRVVGDTEPGLTLMFDLPVEVGLGRAVASQRYEKMGQAFHETLRAAFKDIAVSKDGRKRVVIDAGKNVDQVAQQVLDAVSAAYGLKA
jgi:dTMP kinase